MTVKELIAKLQELPQEHQVVIDKRGGEGSPLDSCDAGHYDAESTWHGSLVHSDDERKNATSVVVLSPVN